MALDAFQHEFPDLARKQRWRLIEARKRCKYEGLTTIYGVQCTRFTYNKKYIPLTKEQMQKKDIEKNWIDRFQKVWIKEWIKRNCDNNVKE